jgi:hydrogenase maturation factor
MQPRNGLPFEDITISALQATMVSAIAKHGDRTPLNHTMADHGKLVILVEEVGEVATAMTYDRGNRHDLVQELLQTAAMALAWAQSIENEPTRCTCGLTLNPAGNCPRWGTPGHMRAVPRL